MSYFYLGLILFIYINFWFVICLIKKRNDLADIAWGLGFILLSWSSFFLSKNFHPRPFLVNFLVTLWGLRLSFHIYHRNKNKEEDYRYLVLRKQWGKLFFIRSYFQIFLLQGIFLFLIIQPVLIINKNSFLPLNFLDFLGVAIWLFGFWFETLADKQLSAFIKNPKNKGKILTSGLWRYSRHPNYFGEVVLWWGIWLFALNTTFGFLTIIGPLTITFLILFVSGVPLLEKKYQGHADYAEYKKTTSAFFPLPPK